jgi:hypothetical protein
VNSGIATALASGPTSGTALNAMSRTGVSATVTTACAWAKERSAFIGPAAGSATATSAATATNDSQKPADVTTSGSPATSRNAAAASTEALETPRRARRSASATPTMAAVRSVGTEAPASSA